MKLCLEKNEYGTFAYLEDERHHKRVHGDRKRTDPRILDSECDLSQHDSFFMVFDVKGVRRKSRVVH